jgi:hypothetical protein
VAPPPLGCDQSNSQLRFAGAVMIGNYAGPLVLDKSGTIAYTASRDTAKLNAVRVAPGGVLQCAPGAGDGATDCRRGLVDLRAAASLDGPYGIVAGDSLTPGQSQLQPVLYVSSVIPHVDLIESGILYTSSSVAALDMNDPTRVLFSLEVSSRFLASGTAIGPMTFDAVRRQLYSSGCYERFATGGAGEPGSGFCGNLGTNLLRIVNVDAQASAIPTLIDLYPDVQSTNTTALVLGDPDASGMPTSLWATMTIPDVLVQIQLAPQPSIPPRVRRVVPLPIQPINVKRIVRSDGGPDLLAVVSEKGGAVAIYDTSVGQVVAQVERLGDTPYDLAQVPCPAGEPADAACLAVSLFGSCAVDLIELSTGSPWNAALRGRLGRCP